MPVIYAAAPLCLGFLLDAVIGDPQGLPHIVRVYGRLISLLETGLRKKGRERAGGVLLVVIMALLSFGIPCAALFFLYRLLPWAGLFAESLLCWQLLAAKALRDESIKVYRDLEKNDVNEARFHLSMIVGRDVENLDETEIAKAAVETVAENASDGVVAPMLYIALGGGAFGCLYKAVNTMDSMVGYKNDKYLDFGRAAARLDDFANYIPSRLAALLMVGGAAICGFDAKNAFRVWRRDRRSHASPNSAQTEAACAGALGVRLGGGAVYFGKRVDKPTIGDDARPIQKDDIRRANRLMYAAAIFMLALSVIIRGILYCARS